MLATKTGWLYKRNEQHVWQPRWCCVVPHTFLYYFDAPAPTATTTTTNTTTGTSSAGGGGGSGGLIAPTSKQQAEWNQAIANGMGNRKPHEKRSHFTSLFPHASAATTTTTTTSTDASSSNAITPNQQHSESHNREFYYDNNFYDDAIATNNNAQPAGIIDLECYTTIHRSSQNPMVLELAGDDQVNPDLRSFYFCLCEGGGEGADEQQEEWADALLNNRHSALADEVEAYKQVADGFACQLQALHEELDNAASAQEEYQKELYRVRSAAEELRRSVYQLTQECAERNPIIIPNNINHGSSSTGSQDGTAPSSTIPLEDRHAEFRRSMDVIRHQDLGVTAAARLCTEYIGSLEDSCATLESENARLRDSAQQTGQSDQEKLADLQAASTAAAARFAAEKEQLVQQLSAAQAASQASQKELQDVQKDLSSTKMEMTMLMSSQRNKLNTEKQHKKILKKEVIDLRQKIEDIQSEYSSLQHEHEKLKLVVEQERSKSDLLSRYVEKMESQVQVQQNMMEMMSQAGGSVYAGGSVVVPHSNSDYTPNRRNRNVAGKPPKVDVCNNNNNDNDDEDDDFENDERVMMQPPMISSRRKYTPRRGGNLNNHNYTQHFQPDDDVKSHVSELTEDRTQREYAAVAALSAAALNNYSSSMIPSSPSRCRRDFIQSRENGSNGARKAMAASSHSRCNKNTDEQCINESPSMQRPPSVIIGVKNMNDNDNLDDDDDDPDDDARCDTNVNLDQQRILHDDHKETIETSIRSLPNSTAVSSTPPLSRKQKPLPRSGGRDSVSVSSSTDHTLESGKKLSVAQRARLEADHCTTPVRARLDEKTEEALKRSNSGTKLNSLLRTKMSPSSSSRDKSDSSGKREMTPESNGQNLGSDEKSAQRGLWRLMEDAVLGPQPCSSSSDCISTDGSINSTRVTDYTEEEQEDRRERLKSDRHLSPLRNRAEEKKSCDSAASVTDTHNLHTLSLQERSQLQREKQLKFLHEQGLIRCANDVRGGAGVSSSASVASSSTSSLIRSPDRSQGMTMSFRKV